MVNTASRTATAHVETQKFGRIEAVRSVAGGTEIDIRRPDRTLLTALLHSESLDTTTKPTRLGRNIWVSGQIEGARIIVKQFAVYAEEQ